MSTHRRITNMNNTTMPFNTEFFYDKLKPIINQLSYVVLSLTYSDNKKGSLSANFSKLSTYIPTPEFHSDTGDVYHFDYEAKGDVIDLHEGLYNLFAKEVSGKQIVLDRTKTYSWFLTCILGCHIDNAESLLNTPSNYEFLDFIKLSLSNDMKAFNQETIKREVTNTPSTDFISTYILFSALPIDKPDTTEPSDDVFYVYNTKANILTVSSNVTGAFYIVSKSLRYFFKQGRVYFPKQQS